MYHSQAGGLAPGPPTRSLAGAPGSPLRARGSLAALVRRVPTVVTAVTVSLILGACGGGGSSPGTGSGGGTTPPPPPVNPCTTALLADTSEAAAIGGAPSGDRPAADKKTLVDGNPRGRLAEAIALNRSAAERRRNDPISAAVHAPTQ